MVGGPAAERIGASIDIISFQLSGQSFCVRTTSVREIRGWVPCTPLPHAPSDVSGVMNLRGSVIAIIDLGKRLGMAGAQADERSAIVVAEVGQGVVGLLVDSVSDMLTVGIADIQPVPELGGSGASFAEGMVAGESGLICFLDLTRILAKDDVLSIAA